MEQRFVRGFGIFLIVIASLVSPLVFYLLSGSMSIIGTISLIGLLLGIVYYKKGNAGVKINRLVSISVVIGIIATLILLIFVSWTSVIYFVSHNTNPSIETYTHFIVISVGLFLTGVIYGIGVLLLIIDWLRNR